MNHFKILPLICILGLVVLSVVLADVGGVASCLAGSDDDGCGEEDGLAYTHVAACAGSFDIGQPDFEDEYGDVPVPLCTESGSGPILPGLENYLRSYGGLRGIERRRSGSVQALAQIMTDRGEEVYEAVDLRIPGVGFDYEHKRTYRSQDITDRAQGTNWMHQYQERIVLQRAQSPVIGASPGPFRAWVRAGSYPGDNARWQTYLTKQELSDGDPSGHFKIHYEPSASHPTTTEVFIPSSEFFSRLELRDTGRLSEASTFPSDWRDDYAVLFTRGGWRREYRNIKSLPGVSINGEIPFNWSLIEYYLTKIVDASGNEMAFSYQLIGGKVRLSKVTDTLGRDIRYYYYGANATPGKQYRLKQVKDFLGRTVDYDYATASSDTRGNLISVESPSVDNVLHTDNKFSEADGYRKTETYTYTIGFANKRQNHNLTGVYRGNENDDRHGLATDNTLALAWEYYCNDRVKSHTIGSGVISGNDWESGGKYIYKYSSAFPNPSGYDLQMEDKPEFRTHETFLRTNATENDPPTNSIYYYYSELNGGSLTRREEVTTDPITGLEKRLVTRHRYSKDQSLGVLAERPDGSITLKEYESRGASYMNQSNMTRRVEIPAPVGGDIQEADQQILDYRYAYDPIYNRPWVEVGPRGTQGVAASPPVGILPDQNDPIYAALIAWLEEVEIFLNLPPSLEDFFDGQNGDPVYTPPNGDPATRQRYAKEWVYEYQETTDLNALALHVGLPRSVLDSLIEYAEDQRARVLGVGGSPPPSRMSLGDVNGDPHTDRLGGKTIKTIFSPVRLPDESAQAILTVNQHDEYGRILVAIDPKLNETHYEYGDDTIPFIDDTDEPFDNINLAYGWGYLEKVTVDPAGLNLVTEYVKNPVGQVLETVDPRGNTNTTVYNELGQPIRSRSYHGDPSSGTLMAESFALYDANNNVIASYIRDIITDSSSEPADYSETLGFNSLPLIAPTPVIPTVPGGVNGPFDPTAISPAGLIGSRTEYNISNLPIRQHVEATHPTPGSSSVWLTTETRYDASQNPAWFKDPLGNITTTLYDERALPIQVTRGLGTLDESTTTTYYDAVGNAVAVVDAYAYSGISGETRMVSNPSELSGVMVLGSPTGLTGGELDMTTHTGELTRMYYDGYNRLKRTVDAIGNETANVYDPAGNIVETAYRGPTGGVSPIDAAGTSNELLSLTRMRHDEANRNYRTDRLVGLPDGTNLAQLPLLSDDDTYFGNDNGFVDSAVVELIDFDDYSGWLSGETVFDANSNVRKSYDDNGDVTETSYDAANRPTIAIDSVGNVTASNYDANSNVVQVRHFDKDQTDASYDTIDAFFDYDALNRKTRARANPGDGDIIDYYGYNSRSNPTVHIDARGNVSRSFFDAASRNVATVMEMRTGGTGAGSIDPVQGGGDGRILTRSVYDDNSRLVAQIDDNNNRTSYTYDALDRKVKTIFGQHNIADGVSVTSGEATLYGVAAGGNLTPQNAKSAPTDKTWQYDKDSNVTVHVDQNKTIHTFSYDGGHRRTQVLIDYTTNGNTHNLAGTTRQDFQYDGLGRQTYALDNNGAADDVTNRWQYDLLSRTLQESTKIGSFPERIQSWQYDGSQADSGSGTPSAQFYADGRRLKYAYDKNDRIKSLTDDLSGASPIVEYKYVGPGTRVKTVERGNGVDLTLAYDDIRRRIGFDDQASGGAVALDLSYVYDAEHQPLRERNLQDTSHSEWYTFDSAGRVLEMNRGEPTPGLPAIRANHIATPDVTQVRNFVLDGVHNKKQSNKLLNGLTINETREHTNFNEIHEAEDTTGTPAELTYDDQGNLLRRDYPAGSGQRSVTYHWDGLNRLREVKLAVSPFTTLVEYLHATGNQRVSRTVADGGVPSSASLNGTHHFYYAGWRLCDEYKLFNGSETQLYQYVWGPRYQDELVVRDERSSGASLAQLNDGVPGAGVNNSGGGRQYQHHDRTWNIRAVTDEAGTVLERYVYDPHGKPFAFAPDGVTLRNVSLLPGGEQSYGFTNQRYDRETGLWYFKHRYLDNGLGRFVSRDPAGYVDGMNMYTAYFVLTGMDPLGLSLIGEEAEIERKQRNEGPEAEARQAKRNAAETARLRASASETESERGARLESQFAEIQKNDREAESAARQQLYDQQDADYKLRMIKQEHDKVEMLRGVTEFSQNTVDAVVGAAESGIEYGLDRAIDFQNGYNEFSHDATLLVSNSMSAGLHSASIPVTGTLEYLGGAADLVPGGANVSDTTNASPYPWIKVSGLVFDVGVASLQAMGEGAGEQRRESTNSMLWQSENGYNMFYENNIAEIPYFERPGE